MKYLKNISLIAALSTLAPVNVAFASGNPPTQEEQDAATAKLNPAEKTVRETGRVVGQVEKAGKNAKKLFKGGKEKGKK